MRITFIRHGETIANVTRRWQGQTDAPLSERGRAQVEALRARVMDLAPSAVVASDLGRAATTARLAFGDRVILDPAWREADVGRWEGLTPPEVAARFPDEMAALGRGEDVKLGGGESRGDLDRRVVLALSALRQRYANAEHVVVVTHGGVLLAVAGHVLGVSSLARRPLGRLVNTSLTTVREEGAALVLERYNDATHLGATTAIETCRDHPEQRALRFVAVGGAACDGVLHHEARPEAEVDSNHAPAEVARVLGIAAGRLVPLALGHALHALADERRVVLVDYNVPAR